MIGSKCEFNPSGAWESRCENEAQWRVYTRSRVSEAARRTVCNSHLAEHCQLQYDLTGIPHVTVELY